MKRALDWCLLLPIHHPRKELAAIALLVALAGLVLVRTGVPIDSRTENILAEADPSVREYAEFKKQFGTDELLMVGIQAPPGQRMVDPAPFALLLDLTRQVQAVAGIDSATVISLASVQVPSVVPGFPPQVSLDPLAERAPADAAEAEKLAARVRELPLLFGFLVSDDLRTACVIAMLESPPAGSDPKEAEVAQVRAVEGVRGLAAAVPRELGYELHVAGTPVVKADFVTLLRRDLAVLIPTCFGLIVLVLIALYRTWRAVLLPLACVVLAVLFTLAVMIATGHALNTITSLLPPLILSVAIGESIHLVAAWSEHRRAPGVDPVAALEAAVRETALPCLLTSVTTVAGFASFELSPILPIREFGRFASLGTCVAFLLTFSLLPALLRLVPGKANPAPAGAGHGDDGGRIGRFLSALATFVIGRPRTVLAVSAVPLAASLLATAAWLEVEVDFVGYFKKDHPIPRATEFFGSRLAGPAPLELAVVGPKGSFGKPESLQRLDELQRRLEALTILDHHGRPLDPIDRTLSMATFVKAANSLQGGPYEVPSDPRRLAMFGLLAQLAGAEGESGQRGLWRLASEDLSRARVSCRMQNLGSRESATLVAAVNALGPEVLGPGYEVHVTGAAVIFLEVSQAITESQKTSFIGAMVLVFGAMLLVFRSPRAALLCVIPNLFPIAFTFGFMAVTGITLNMGTAMVASIAIGVAVDDTVHFLTGFGRYIAQGLEPPEAVAATFRGVGPANLALTLILCLGFGVTTLASFYPTIHFGVLSSWTIAVAFYGDFVLLPALLVLLWPRTTGTFCPVKGA